MSKAKQKPLIIIEGPGKINKFKRISEGTITNGTVFATHGRLFDLPKNVIGIEFKDGKYQAEWEPIKPKLIDALKEAIKSSTEVILATDNDSEGHLIAWQISRISDAMNKPSSRIIINELTEASFSHAYDNKTQCNHVQAEPALRRRLFDRLISYNEYNDQKDNTITVSRIKSPLSKILNEGNYESGKLIITTENLSITAEVPQSHVSQIESLKVRITKALTQSGSQLKCDITSLAKPKSHELNSYQQNLIEFAEETGEKVIDIHNAAQSLYEDGAISYPRTINTKIHRSTAKFLQKFAARSGQKFNINNNSILSNTESASTNHEALHAIKEPLTTCMHKNANINERLHNFIYQKTLDIGSNKIKRANTSKSAINCNYELMVILSEFSKNIEVIESKDKKENSVEFKKHNNDLIVLKVLDKYNIGQPSTIALHAAKYGRTLLNKDSEPSHKCAQILSLSANKAPKLLQREGCELIEGQLADVTKDSHSIIYNSLLSIKNTSPNESYKSDPKINNFLHLQDISI